jgi:hypothetical protein
VFTVRIFDTPVRVNIKILPILIVLWGGITWLGLYWHPGRSLWEGLLISFVSTVLLSLSDFAHPLGHIFSARYAGAPMDEIIITSDMPRTLYRNNDVAPKVHRMRALGGPIYNVTCLFLSLVIFQVAPGHSIVREWMGWSSTGHAFILVMSLLPLPMVDGGTILKWTLVAGGRTEIEADKLVRRVDWVLGITVILVGIGILLVKLWIAGGILIITGAIILGIAASKAR